jgi:LemA protein
VDADARLARMEAEGLLTAAQAESLREALAGQSERKRGNGVRTSRRYPGLTFALVIGLLLALVIFFVSGGNEVPEMQGVAATLNQPEELGGMNRSFSTILAVVVLLVVPLLILVWSYNSLVSKEEAVLSAWAQTESNFQRRADLVPALVETVTRFMKHERDTLTATTEQRSRTVGQLSEAIDTLTERQRRVAEILSRGAPLEDQERLDALSRAEAAVGREIAGFVAIAEDYPALRSADQFLELQAQLEGTENRINVARMRFNEAVRIYNGALRRLPANLVAGIGNFKRKAYFQAEQGAAEAPDIAFE